MSTIAQLKNNHDLVIRTSLGANSVSTDDVAIQFDNLADETLVRGVISVTNTTELENQSGANTKTVLVKDIGLFVFSTTGTANGTTIFNATGGGVWIHVLGPGSGLTLGDKGDINVGGFADWR